MMSVNITDLIKEDYTFTFEDILINLKLIGDINVNDKLKISENSLDIDNRYMQSVIRTLYGDGRNKTIKFINSLIIHASYNSNSLISILNDKENIFENDNKHFKHQLNTLICCLNSSLNGLDKLKITYKDDNIFVANINLAQDKIRVLLTNNMNNVITVMTPIIIKSPITKKT